MSDKSTMKPNEQELSVKEALAADVATLKFRNLSYR